MKNANTIKEACFEHNGKRYEIELRRDYEKRTGKAFVWGTTNEVNEEEFIKPYADFFGLDSIYTQRGEYPFIDKAFDLMNKLIVNDKMEILQAGLRALDMPVDDWKWSRKAGCSCGCSPGFNNRNLAFQNCVVYISQIEEKETSQAA